MYINVYLQLKWLGLILRFNWEKRDQNLSSKESGVRKISKK